MNIVAKRTYKGIIQEYLMYDNIEHTYITSEKNIYGLEIPNKLPDLNLDNYRICSKYNKQEYIGKQYNKLKVDYFVVAKLQNNCNVFKWLCSCNCGSKPSTYYPSKVVNSRAKSCGCDKINNKSVYKNLEYINKIYNHLEVKQIARIADTEGVHWICKCKLCNKEVEFPAKWVVQGKVKTCGKILCKRSAGLTRLNYADDEYINCKYDLLTVKGYYVKNSQTYWECNCECGNDVDFLATAIVNGNNKSCGCLKSYGEYLIQKIFNEYSIKFEREYSFCDLVGVHGRRLRFDFKLEIENKIIMLEYQGKQHYENYGNWNLENLNTHDILKQEYCRKHGIELVEIKSINNYNTMKAKLESLGLLD